MATKFYQGKDGSFKIGSTATASVESWTATVTAVTEEYRFFGDSGWAYPIITGQAWSGTIAGRLYLSDANQLSILNTVISGTAEGINNVNLFINNAICLKPDPADEDATIVFSNFSIDSSAGTIIGFTTDFVGRGACTVSGIA